MDTPMHYAARSAAIRTSPHLALAHINRGIVFHTKEHIAEAEAEYDTAMALDASAPVTQNNLGLIHMSRGDLANAEKLFRAELRVNPEYDKAHFNLGLALARQGRIPDAATSWREAIRINPANTEARENLQRAESMVGAAFLPEAIPDGVPAEVLVHLYEEALGRDPTNEAIRRAYREMCIKRSVTCPAPVMAR